MNKQRFEKFKADIECYIRLSKMPEPEASRYRKDMLACFDNDEKVQMDKIAKEIGKSLQGLE